MRARTLQLPLTSRAEARAEDTARSTSWALYAFCAWLVLLPLPLGSNRTWALALSLPPLMLLAFVVAWRRGDSWQSSLPATLIRWPGVFLLAFLALLLLQLSTIGGTAISIVPQRTVLYLLITVGCAVSFWLVTALVRTEQALRTLLYGLVTCGAVQAMIAVALVSGKIALEFFDSELTPDQFTGTFTNRNHLAAYLNICIAAGVGMLMGKLAAPHGERKWRQRLRDWVALVLSDKARLRLVLVLIVIALILTRSRMGNAAFFVGLLLAASVYAIYARSRRRGLLIFIASIIIIDVALIGAWVGVDRVVERFQNTSLMKPDTLQEAPAPAAAPAAAREESVEERVDYPIEALDIVRRNALFGTGGGSFFLAYMEVAPRDKGFIMHAHNDFLEIASDTGVVGLAALLLLALAALWESIRILRHRRNEVARAAAFCTMMALACLGLHSFVDFNLQVPALAMTASVIVALPFSARSFSSRRRNRSRGARAGGVLGPFMAGVTTVIVVWTGYAIAQFGLADVLSIRGSRHLAAWEVSGTPLSPEVAYLVDDYMTKAIAIAPRNAEYHETLGSLDYALSLVEERSDEARARSLASSLDRFREATRHARTSPYAWGNLMLTKARAGELDAEFGAALQNAARYGPFEPNVQGMIIGAGLANWARLDANQRAVVAATVDRAWETNAGTIVREALAAPGREVWCAGDGGLLKLLCERLRSLPPPRAQK